MSFSHESLDRSADARWTAVLEARPELGDAVALHRRLIAGVIAVMQALERDGEPSWTIGSERLTSKLAQGVPALREEIVPLPMGILGPGLLQFCRELEDGGAGEAARHIRAALESRRLESRSLLVASLARDERGIRAGAGQIGLAPDLLWLLGELTVGPVAARLSTRLFGLGGDDHVASLWHAWDRGYCPTCGSWPALIEVSSGQRQPRCSFCGTAWAPSFACTYCGEAGEAFGTAAPNPDQPQCRLELCSTCGGYVKTLDVTEPSPFPFMSIDDLASADLDLAAMERGHRRLSLPEIAAYVDPEPF